MGSVTAEGPTVRPIRCRTDSRMAALVAVTTLVAPGNASAEGPEDPRCEGVHGVWAPLPDGCLSVIDTDRPTQTDTPHVVPVGHVVANN